MQRFKLHRQGFTLIELLVSISIIATLTAILLPNFLGAREKAADARKKSDMVSLKNSLRLYYNDNQNYPANRAAWNAAVPTYAPQFQMGIGYTYYYRLTNGGDGFQLCVDLSGATGTEIADSQNRCKESGNFICASSDDTSASVGGAGTANRYVVCAN